LALLLILGSAVGSWQYINHEECPEHSNFSEKFNQWSIEFLDGHPEYGEKEQREGWQKHLEDMGCVEAEDILDNITCADCEETKE
jgi:hypothetical protein